MGTSRCPALPRRYMTPALLLAGALGMAGWMPPALAQSGIYGFDSSYRVFSGSAGSGWQPGSGSVYRAGRTYQPAPAASSGRGYSPSGYGGSGGVYGSRPSGTTSRAAPAYGGSRYAPSAPAAQFAATDVGGAGAYYEDDGPPLPVYRGASGGKGVDPKFNRRLVNYSSGDPAGTIIVDTGARFLYLVQPGGKALRYGIGVGKEGFAWSGSQRISNKREWPTWTPPAEMIARRPDLPNQMAGGPDNPLGARALYLGNTLYRIHGSNEPETIGQAVSSGCIRMRNEDVIDLYERVSIGALVRVI